MTHSIGGERSEEDDIMNWNWPHKNKDVLTTDKATQAESRLQAIKRVRKAAARSKKAL